MRFFRFARTRITCLLGTAGVVVAGCGSPTQGGEGTLFGSPVLGELQVDLFYGAYVDHSGRDYACGTKVFDGHEGVDILIPNFRTMDSGVVVVAAADGVVSGVVDGQDDRSTQRGAGGFGNHVVLDHPDGLQSYYTHLRRATIPVQIGDEVRRGDWLGLIGSSGDSNWPSLHFEVRDALVFVPLDPFRGDCQDRAASRWEDQIPYQDAFRVIDGGITDNVDVNLRDMLERPADVDTFTTADAGLFSWTQVFNVQASRYTIDVISPSGTVVVGTSGGPVQSFSVRHVGLRVDIAGFLDEPGQWTVSHRMIPLSGGAEVTVQTHDFILVRDDAAPPASPTQSPPHRALRWFDEAGHGPGFP